LPRCQAPTILAIQKSGAKYTDREKEVNTATKEELHEINELVTAEPTEFIRGRTEVTMYDSMHTGTLGMKCQVIHM
jgi:hypothetical protein